MNSWVSEHAEYKNNARRIIDPAGRVPLVTGELARPARRKVTLNRAPVPAAAAAAEVAGGTYP